MRFNRLIELLGKMEPGDSLLISNIFEDAPKVPERDLAAILSLRCYSSNIRIYFTRGQSKTLFVCEGETKVD
jgi:hypothetical protein